MATRRTHKVGLLICRQMIAMVFGLTVLWSGASLTTFLMLFGVYALADSLFSLIVRALNRHDSGHSWGLVLKGATGIAVGGIACLRPNVTALLPLIAAWAILTGVLDVLAVLPLRNVSDRSRQLAWDAVNRRQRQMAWDGAIDRTMLYARAEQIIWDNKSERKMRAVRLGDGLCAKPVSYTAQNAGKDQWGQYS